MASELQLLASVALLRDHPEHGLLRGEVGTVVEVYETEGAEVEFVDEEGRTYALVPLLSADLMPLRQRTRTAA